MVDASKLHSGQRRSSTHGQSLVSGTIGVTTVLPTMPEPGQGAQVQVTMVSGPSAFGYWYCGVPDNAVAEPFVLAW